MTNDLISDMLTRIRNATMARHSFTYIPYSKLNLNVLKVLVKEGYISNFEVCPKPLKPNQQIIKAFLKYKGWWIKKPFFSSLKRVSKPGQRVFCSYKKFEKKIEILKDQQGIAIISTSNGVMSHTKAIKLKKGGEILCYIG
jgi:small subunit ribosomal protein S8